LTDDAQFCTVNFAPSDRVLTADYDDNVTVSCRLSYFAASNWIPRVQCLPSVEDQTEVVDVAPGNVSYSKSFAATPEINGVVLDCVAKFNATGYTPQPGQASNAPPDLPLWKSQTLHVQCTHLLLALLYVLPRGMSTRVCWASVCPSVRPSVPSGRCMLLLRVCCCGPGGQEISIDAARAAGRRSAAAAPQQMRAVPRCQLT